MSKSQLVLSAVVVLAAAFCLSHAAVFDGVDTVALLQNETVVASYVRCIMGTGECNESAQRLKSFLPNALTGKCSECSDQQKVIFGNIIAKMQKNFPTDYEKLLDKYDPEKKHREEILALAKAATAAIASTSASPTSTTAA